MLICGMTKAPPFTGTLITVNGEYMAIYPEHPEACRRRPWLRRRALWALRRYGGALIKTFTGPCAT